MIVSNNNIGAVSALKGYRVQFLYSLSRILSRSENETKFHPEGIFEDLDIYNPNNEVIEIIQVKALKEKLTLSNILSSNENSFLRRAIKSHAGGNSPIIRLVSFGEVNDEVKELRSKIYSAKVISKLKQLRLNALQIKILQDYFDFEIANEDQIYSNIISNLEKLGLFADSKVSLELFIYWLYNTAEKQQVIEAKDLKNKLLKISAFQKERVDFIQHFGTLIKPLPTNIDLEDSKKLQADFYQGISASYKHILADVDVLRLDKLQQLNTKFSESNIVFIHGASGQGKSTLAYRYLANYCNDDAVFELKLPPDFLKVYEVINALEGISKGVGFPITLYIDITPGNNEWVRILEELSSKKIFNFLITIREEDWNRTDVGDKFQFSETELTLDEEEAKQIYLNLNKFKEELRFPSFEEAWNTFGGNGPLLEFIYLITQKESLPEKLKSQINKIREASFNHENGLDKIKLKLLRYVVLADSFGARIKYREITNYLGLEDLNYIINLLEKEYLLQTVENNSYITGLHPVRSIIIKDILFGNDLHLVSDYILDSLPLISDNTILSFLRNAFKKADLDVSRLLENFKNYNLNSWEAYYQVLQSLLWKGTFDYLNDNVDILNEVYQEYNKGWLVIINFDFANVVEGKSLMENLDFFSEEQRAYAKSVNSRFTDRSNIFKHCYTWLNTIERLELKPKSEQDWNSFGLILFWLCYFKVDNIAIEFSNFNFNKSFKENSLSVLATVLYSLKQYNQYSIAIAKEVEPIFIERLCAEFNIVSIDKNNGKIICHYFTNIIDEKIETEETDILHAKSIKIIDLIRLAFPEKELFGTNGYGHKFSFLPDAHDATIKEIPKASLPLKPLTKINSTIINLFTYYNRPNSWQEYVERIIEQRRSYTKILGKLLNAFQEFHKQKGYQPLINYIQEYTQENKGASTPSLPKNIIDEWGEFSEGSGKAKRANPNSQNKPDQERESYKQRLALRKYDNFIGITNKYSSGITNFIKQSTEILYKKLKEIKNGETSITENDSRISTINLFNAFECLEEYQTSFKSHFNKYINSKELQRIEIEENELIKSLCFIWRHFIYSQSFLQGKISKVAINHVDEIKTTLEKNISSFLRKLGKEVDATLRVIFLEDKQQCLIFADTKNSIQSLTIIKEIYNSLFYVFNHPEYTSIKCLVIDTYISSFVIIPTILGKSLSNKYSEFKSNNLINIEFDQLKQFNLIPKNIEHQIIDKYKIQTWNKLIPELIELEELLTSIQLSYQLAFHFAQLGYWDSKENIEEVGSVTLQGHIRKVGKLLITNIVNGLEKYTNILEACNNGIYLFDDDNEKFEFYQLLINNIKNFFPNDELHEKRSFQVSFGIKEMQEWIPRLEELSQNVTIIYYFLAGKIIDRNIDKRINL